MNTQTITRKKTTLEVKVLAINTLYEYASKIIKDEKEILTPFLGKAIFKVDGSLKAKYEHEKPMFTGTLPDGTKYDVHYWYLNSYESLYLNIKVCVRGGSYDDHPSTAYCQYEQLRTSIFSTKDGILSTNTTGHEYLNKRYSVNELMEIEKEVKEAAEVYRKSYAKMPHLFSDVLSLERLSR